MSPHLLLILSPLAVPGNLEHSRFQREDILTGSNNLEAHALISLNASPKVIRYDRNRREERPVGSRLIQKTEVAGRLEDNSPFNFAWLRWRP